MQDRLDYLKEIATQAKSNATEKYAQIANSIKLEDTPYYFYDNLGSIFFLFYTNCYFKSYFCHIIL